MSQLSDIDHEISIKALDKLSDFKKLAKDDHKNDWIINQFINFLKTMETAYPMGARDQCNDIIISQPRHSELTDILSHIASVMLKTSKSIDSLKNKKYLLNLTMFYTHVPKTSCFSKRM